MIDAQLPPPLTPPDCDLKSLRGMMLDVQRLRDSALARHENPEVVRSNLLLWCKAWHETPAASLKDDDGDLADFAGFGRFVAQWKAVREEVLSSWVRCSDGRLYHPVVAEKALEAHIGLLMRRSAGAQGNDAQGKASGAGAHAHALAMGDAAARLRLLNPSSDAIKKPAVKSALAAFDAASASPEPEDDAPRTNSERNASEVITQSERIASPNASAMDTHRQPTAHAVRTQYNYKGNITPQPPLEGGVLESSKFDEAWGKYPQTGRASTRLDLAGPAWASAAREVGETALLGCVERLATSEYARQDGGKKVQGFHRFLLSGKWRNWLPTGGAASVSAWSGPDWLREAIIAHVADARHDRAAAEAWTASYVDASTTWSEVPPALVCRAGGVERQLRTMLASLLKDHGVSILLKPAEAAA